MVGKHWREMGKRITGSAVCLALLLGLLGCSQQSSPLSMADNAFKGVLTQNPNIEEVSTPVVIQQLRRSLFSQAPQVKIVGLKPDVTIEQTTANIRFEVDDFPLFKDSELDLGPHLTVLLDDQPYADVYDAKQSITFTDLRAGTHRVQVFASTPWNESLKTPGAFDQLSFNVFAPNRAAADQPRLIYSQPKGEYGAEPILLDYILMPPLGQNNVNTKVQVTVNGNSFITEEQPPIYLKGFKPGTNWVKLEVLDSSDKAIANSSEIIQLVTLNTGGADTLSKLTRGDLDAKDAAQIMSLEASQRRAAQKRAALSASTPTPTPTPTPQPKAIAPASSPEPSIRPSAAVDKTVAPSIPTKAPDAVAKPKNKPTALPIPEKMVIEKSADAEPFPAIAWKKFLKFKAGEDRAPSALRNPGNPKSLPSSQAKTTEPKTEPSEVSSSTPASNIETATSKT